MDRPQAPQVVSLVGVELQIARAEHRDLARFAPIDDVEYLLHQPERRPAHTHQKPEGRSMRIGGSDATPVGKAISPGNGLAPNLAPSPQRPTVTGSTASSSLSSTQMKPPIQMKWSIGGPSAIGLSHGCASSSHPILRMHATGASESGLHAMMRSPAARLSIRCPSGQRGRSANGG
ncbi:hypothetical protein [Jannaschia seohaensis]|uniref:hypothetical protein n=1 Tax=Jannaschia seohaensis TaxID=475081 RepID=UPI0011B27066|nr:hypothetical protein [Jannaschia seohaensis]